MRRGDRSRFGDFCLPKEKAGTRNRAGIKVYERGLGKQHRVLVRWGGLPCVPATWWECGTEEPRSPPCPSFIASHDLACAQLGGGLCHTAHPTSRAPLILFPFIFIFWLCPQLAAPSGGALISAAYVEHCPPAVPTRVCAKTRFFPTTAHLNLHPFPLPSSRNIKQGLGPPQ